MGIILFVCPDKGLESQVKACIPKEDKQIEVIVSHIDSIAEDLNRIDREITLIVSRGQLGQVIMDNFTYPVIMLHISFADVLKQIDILKSDGAKKIAVLGSKYWIERDLSDMPESVMGCSFIIVKDREERHLILQKLPEMGYDSVITIETDAELARSYGLRCLSLMTSTESIKAGLKEARFVADVIHKEALRAKQVRTLLDTSEDAHVMINANEITYANNMAKNLFGDKNLTIEDMRPYYHMHNLPHKVNETLVLVNSTTYTLSNDEYGYILSFKDIENIHNSEQIMRRSQQQGFVAKNHFDSIMCESISMKRCINDARQYAKYNSNVLITGETGTGKELFAQSIHNASSRKNEPFVSVNCASIQPGMLEGEPLSKTDSKSGSLKRIDRYGLLELAHGGTLFLDEIGNLSMNLQAQLLRVLQEKELLRVEDDKVIPLDVRIICSTNQDLQKLIEEGRFRADLYYRINALSLNIPNLRSRKADIGPLYKYFVHMYNSKYDTKVKLENEACIRILENYSWPGNTRELMNVAERSVILCKGRIISESFLSELIINELEAENSVGTKTPKRRRKPGKAELENLLKVYSKQDICEILGISRSTLWRLIKSMDLKEM